MKKMKLAHVSFESLKDCLEIKILHSNENLTISHDEARHLHEFLGMIFNQDKIDEKKLKEQHKDVQEQHDRP